MKKGDRMGIEFIDNIPLDLQMMEENELVSPQDKLDPEDQALGELSLELKKLYTLWKGLGKSAGALQNDITWGVADPEKSARANALKSKAQVVSMILWIAIQDELNLWHLTEPLAIRKGFRVVSYKSPAGPFYSILGGPG